MTTEQLQAAIDEVNELFFTLRDTDNTSEESSTTDEPTRGDLLSDAFDTVLARVSNEPTTANSTILLNLARTISLLEK